MRFREPSLLLAVLATACDRPTTDVLTLRDARMEEPLVRELCATRAEAALTVDRRDHPSRWPESAFRRQLTYGKGACVLHVEAKLGAGPDGPRIGDGKFVEVRAGRVNVLGDW